MATHLIHWRRPSASATPIPACGAAFERLNNPAFYSWAIVVRLIQESPGYYTLCPSCQKLRDQYATDMMEG